MADQPAMIFKNGFLSQISSSDTLTADNASIGTVLKIPTGSADPGSPVTGQLFFNTTDQQLKIRVIGGWVLVGVLQ